MKKKAIKLEDLERDVFIHERKAKPLKSKQKTIDEYFNITISKKEL